MNRFTFIFVPVVGLSLWLGAAAFTITRLESMSKSVSHLKRDAGSAPMVTASR
jgi:hypothetical protein